MDKIIKYKIIDHGYEHAQYFQGQGTSFTGYDLAFTGIGNNAKEAYNDALDWVYSTPDIDPVSLNILPIRPYGIRLKDKIPARHLKDEIYWYVSILIKIKKGGISWLKHFILILV